MTIIAQLKFWKNPFAKIYASIAITVVSLLVFGISEYGFEITKEKESVISEYAKYKNEIESNLRQLVQAETSLRGYIITERNEYLQEYRLYEKNIRPNLIKLRDKLINNAALLPFYGGFSFAVSQAMGSMEQTLRLMEKKSKSAAYDLVDTDFGKEKMEEVRKAYLLFSNKIDETAENWTKESESTALLVRWGVRVTTFLTLVAFIFYLRAYHIQLRNKELEAKALLEEKIVQEKIITERTAEITELATHLEQVREHEKNKLARDLHDELGSILTAAKLDLAYLSTKLKDAPENIQQKMQQLLEMLNRGISIKRRFIEDLRPTALSNLGFVAALNELIEQFRTRHDHIKIRILSEEKDTFSELTEQQSLIFYRVLQESLTNISKYSQASNVNIHLTRFTINDNEGLLIVIEDNGIGINFKNLKKNRGHGISGMKFRITSFNGIFRLNSKPNKGTRLEAFLPFVNTATEEDTIEMQAS